MGEGDRLLGGLDGLQSRLVADVREVDQDAQLVHDANGVPAEVAKPVVHSLVAPVAEQVALVVRHLDDPDAELVEECEAVQVVLDGRRVLPAQEDRGPAVALGLEHVVGGPALRQGVGALVEPAEPAGDVVHRVTEPFPDGDGRVDGGDPADMQALVDVGAAPRADVQPVDHDRLVVDPRCGLFRSHLAVLLLCSPGAGVYQSRPSARSGNLLGNGKRPYSGSLPATVRGSKGRSPWRGCGGVPHR